MILPKPRYAVDLIAENDKHNYSIDGNQTYLPGVTGILDMASKPALVAWSAKTTALYMAQIIRKAQDLQKANLALPRYLSARFIDTLVLRAKRQPHFAKVKAGEIGSAAHALIDQHITGKTAISTMGSMPTVMKSYLLWREKEKLKVVGGDLKVASLKYGYGGSLDVLLQDENGALVIGDFKTSNYIFDTYAAQVASYAMALVETYGLKEVPRGVIVRFDKEKVGYERREVSSISDSFKIFRACLDLYSANQLVHFSNRETVRPEKVKKAVN